MPIRIVICDNHARVRAGLRTLLGGNPAYDVVAEARDADEALAAVSALRPDVLVLDIVLPGRSGLAALPDLLASSPSTAVLILSMQDDATYVRRAFSAGARGYLLKETAGAELIRAIDDVAAGRRYADPALGAWLAPLDHVPRRAVPERRTS